MRLTRVLTLLREDTIFEGDVRKRTSDGLWKDIYMVLTEDRLVIARRTAVDDEPAATSHRSAVSVSERYHILETQSASGRSATQ